MILIFYSTNGRGRKKKNGGQCYLCWAEREREKNNNIKISDNKEAGREGRRIESSRCQS
jgi:hypothetical protein